MTSPSPSTSPQPKSEPKLFVLTGGPHSGKTTTLAELEKRGYQILPESALTIINTLNSMIGQSAQKEWRRTYVESFQVLLGVYQQQLETGLTTGTWILDRSVIDCIAYCDLRNKGQVPEQLKRLIKPHLYQKVFMLDLVLPFSQRGNTGRTSTEAEARTTQDALSNTYKQYGYNPVMIPFNGLSAGQRADLIEAQINA